MTMPALKQKTITMNIKIWYLMVCLLATLCPAADFEIDSAWQIVCFANAAPTERKAAADVAEYIKKVSGLQLNIVATQSSKKAIIIQKNEALAEEAWDVKCTAEGLLITGGLPNGILYAANEFIEQGLGCRFLTWDVEYVPEKGKLILPDNFKCAGKPFFQGRSIYRGWTSGSTNFSVQSKLNGGIFAGPEFGWYDRVVDNQGGHTYYLYSSKFPEDKPEWGSMHSDGKRQRAIKSNGPGQLCLSQPGVRDFVFNEMVIRINKEREELKRANRPYSKVIDLSANDNNQKCVCPDCLALEKKYGSYTGVMLDFTNDIAARLEKLFPDMLIQTFAYEYTEEAPPPGTIAPRKNVMIHLAQLGGEYYGVTKVQRDSLRNLDHPNNRGALEEILSWGRFGTPLKMWDYWVLYDQRCNFPYTVIPALAPNIRKYAANNVCRIFAESEVLMGSRLVMLRNFVDLTNYLGAKLMVNPDLDEEAVIADFMECYYGPAAKSMAELLLYLEEAMKSEPANIGKVGIGVRYLTPEFFAETEKLLAAAEKTAQNDPSILERIGQERIPFDEAALDLQAKLSLPIDRKAVVERYRANFRKAFERYASPGYAEKYSKDLEQHLELIGKRVDIPERFANKRVFDFPVFTLLKSEYPSCTIIDDPQAAGGKAVKLGSSSKTDAEFHSKNLQFGVYSPAAKKFHLSQTVQRDAIFKDENYHWYYIGRTSLMNDSLIWVHWSWRLGLKCAGTVYNPVLPDAEYGIWLSIKLEGDAYAPGSKNENAVIVDRIIITKE